MLAALDDEALGAEVARASAQKTQPSCAPASLMYSRRQGAQIGLVTSASSQALFYSRACPWASW